MVVSLGLRERMPPAVIEHFGADAFDRLVGDVQEE